MIKRPTMTCLTMLKKKIIKNQHCHPSKHWPEPPSARAVRHPDVTCTPSLPLPPDPPGVKVVRVRECIPVSRS